jgi:hypothetical protein
MLVLRTAEEFRAALSALRSLDGSKGVSSHTFSLPEDTCVRLLVKNLGRYMLRTSSGGSWRIWASVSMGSYSSPRAAVTRRPPRLVPLPRTLLYRWRGAPKWRKCAPSPSSAVCESRWRRTSHRRDHCSSSAAKASAMRSDTAATHPGVLFVLRLTYQGSAPPSSRSLNAAAVEETTQPNTGVA